MSVEIINCNMNLDEIKYQLQNKLTVKQLVEFCISLADKLSEGESFYKLFRKELTKSSRGHPFEKFECEHDRDYHRHWALCRKCGDIIPEPENPANR